MGILKLVFFLISLSTTSIAQKDPNPNHILMRHSRSTPGHQIPSLDCLSWRLGVETNNIRNWSLSQVVYCVNYVGDYMLGEQYPKDCNVVLDEAILHARNLKVIGDGKDIWVFDIDETALSNLGFYAQPDIQFGKNYNRTKFQQWIEAGTAPALPAALHLYNVLAGLNIKVVFLSGSSDDHRPSRIRNLHNAGYPHWEKLILRPTAVRERTGVFKSRMRRELEEGGYRIVGNIGDQWSDITGTHVGIRTFKFPNPMYYVG